MHQRRRHRRWNRETRHSLYVGLAALCLCAAAMPAAGQSQAPGATDERERILVPAPARNMVLAEMRQMLRSLEGVLSGLAEGDRAAAAEAARASGMAVAVDVSPEVRARLPEAFVQLGMATHQGFDALAAKLKQPLDTGAALAELSALTQNCVACHATYRLDEAP
jgi:hypothetical protein